MAKNKKNEIRDLNQNEFKYDTSNWIFILAAIATIITTIIFFNKEFRGTNSDSFFKKKDVIKVRSIKPPLARASCSC